jgi:hypothetical protein
MVSGKKPSEEESLLAAIVPESFLLLLGAFRPCFTAPSYENFVSIVAGWVHCLGRRTVTAVALASGALSSRHISVFHRFFGRAGWALDALGQALFKLAVAWVPAPQPLLLVLDDTLARKGGKTISLRHSVTINIRGESYRLKDKRKAGVFRALETQIEH